MGITPFLIGVVLWQFYALDAQELAKAEKAEVILEDWPDIPADTLAATIEEVEDPLAPTWQMIARSAVKYGATVKDEYGAIPLIRDTLISMKTFFIGFALSCVIGITLGLLIASFSYFEAFFKWSMLAVHKPAALALVPIILMWVGSGFKMHLALIVVGIFPTLMLITYSAVKSVPEQLTIAGMTLGYSNIENVFHISLPYALPQIIDGIISILNAVMLFLLAAEQIANAGGFGHSFFLMGRNFDVGGMIFYNVVISFYLLVINLIWIWIRRKLCNWKKK